VEGKGVPLAVIITGANRTDGEQTAQTLDATVVVRPDPQILKQHLCVDNAYDNQPSRTAMTERGYEVHIPAKGLDTSIPPKGDPARHPARRWVVERAHAWLHKFRKILVRYERYAINDLGLLQRLGIASTRLCPHCCSKTFRMNSKNPSQKAPSLTALRYQSSVEARISKAR